MRQGGLVSVLLLYSHSCPVVMSVGMMAATHSSLTDSVSLQVGPDEKLLQDPPPAPPTWNIEAFVDAVKTKVLGTSYPACVSSHMTVL